MAKSEILKARVSPEEKELIKQAAEILGLTMSEFMRVSILDKSKSVIAVNKGVMTREEMVDWIVTRARAEAYSAST